MRYGPARIWPQPILAGLFIAWEFKHAERSGITAVDTNILGSRIFLLRLALECDYPQRIGSFLTTISYIEAVPDDTRSRPQMSI